MKNERLLVSCAYLFFLFPLTVFAAPELPLENGAVTLPAQEWPQQPGPREIKAYLFYPGGSLTQVNRGTGMILTLHNWGGTAARGAPDPALLASRFNLIGIAVDYLQSGPYDPKAQPPYDYGMLQAMDALRALYFAYSELNRLQKPFAKGRIYATGGSGGGNVSLMAGKFAPRTFAVIIDLCGMAKLSDDIAFDLPGGSRLDAGYSQDPASPRYLPPHAQELRFLGHPGHLRAMQQLGCATHTILVHGADDDVCPVADKQELAEHMREAGLDVETHFITAADLDGKALTSSGHPLGDRTEIVCKFAADLLRPDAAAKCVRSAPNDFECRDEKTVYEVTGGKYIVSYMEGWPVLRFVPTPSAKP